MRMHLKTSWKLPAGRLLGILLGLPSETCTKRGKQLEFPKAAWGNKGAEDNL